MNCRTLEHSIIRGLWKRMSWLDRSILVPWCWGLSPYLCWAKSMMGWICFDTILYGLHYFNKTSRGVMFSWKQPAHVYSTKTYVICIWHIQPYHIHTHTYVYIYIHIYWHLLIFSHRMPEPKSKCGHLIYHPLRLHDLCNACPCIPASRWLTVLAQCRYIHTRTYIYIHIYI